MELDDVTQIRILIEGKKKQGKTGFDVEEKDYFQKVYNFLKKNNYDTTRFEGKLKTLQLIRVPEKEIGLGASYKEKDNCLVYWNENDLYHETFHIATKGIVISRDDLTIGKGLNEGITDMFTRKIKNDANLHYKFENMCAEVLKMLYGEDIYKPYFNGSGEKFVNQFEQNMIYPFLKSLDEYNSLMTEFYTNLSNRKSIGGIHSKIAEAFHKVIFEIVYLCRSNMGNKTSEVGIYLDEQLNSDEFATIRDTIEIGGGTTHVLKYFDLEKKHKK